MACFRVVSVGFFLALVFAGLAAAENFQSVYVSNGTDEFYNLTLVGCTTDAICADVFNQSFTSASNRTGAYVIVELGENTTYNDDYYFSAYIDNKLLYNRTRTYAGRGNITAAMVWTAAPNNGDTTHLTTAGGVYTWVTGLGYLSAESDPQVDTVNFGDVCQGDGGGNVDCDLNTDGSGDCTAGAVCLGGHDHSGYLTAESDPQVGTLTEGKVCKASGGAVECIYDGTTAADVFLNISALQGNVSDLWINASDQSALLVALWSNASVQSAQLVLLWGNASAQETHIGNLWGNASDQQTKINFLMLNASNQDTRILALEGRPLQPSVDAANVTSGTILNARMNATWLITSDECTAGQFYLYGTGCVVAPAAQPNIAGENITSGTVADARIASTLTRDTEVPSLETDAAHDTCAEIGGCVVGAITSYSNCSGMDSCPLIYYPGGADRLTSANISDFAGAVQAAESDAAHDTCAEIGGCVVGAITDGNTGWDNVYGLMSTVTQNLTYLNANYLNKSGTLTNAKVCTYNSAVGTIDCNSDPSSYNDAWAVNNISSLWTNASDQDARIIALEGVEPGAYDDVWIINNLSFVVVNITALQGNVTDLWTNASQQSALLAWAISNGTLQDARIVWLEGNATQQDAHITNLWANASNQDGRLTATESALSANQTAWKANDSVQETHIRNLGMNVSALQGNVSGLTSNVTTLQGTAGDLWTNASNQDWRIKGLENNASMLWGNITGLVNNVTSLRGNVTEAINNITAVRGNITGLNVNVTTLQNNMATVTINVTALQGNVTALWTNATNQQAQLWNKNSTCLWVRFA